MHRIPENIASVIGSLLIILTACAPDRKNDSAGQGAAETLMQIGDSILTRNMVASQIPPGLSSADSIRMFDAITEAWVERNMLAALAGSQLPDLEKIDRMVEQYRTQLLANEYRRIMAQDKASGVTEQSIKAYYNANPDLYILNSPILKGIYVKVASDAPQIKQLHEWMQRASSDDIDELERYGLKGAMEYDYFGDTWISWETIAERIPYRFSNPDTFVKETTLFEWEDQGTTYMLRILDALNSGEKMPFSFAQPEIEDHLIDQNRDDYDRKLLQELYSKGLKDNSIKPGAYIPLKYRSSSTTTK